MFIGTTMPKVFIKYNKSGCNLVKEHSEVKEWNLNENKEKQLTKIAIKSCQISNVVVSKLEISKGDAEHNV